MVLLKEIENTKEPGSSWRDVLIGTFQEGYSKLQNWYENPAKDLEKDLSKIKKQTELLTTVPDALETRLDRLMKAISNTSKLTDTDIFNTAFSNEEKLSPLFEKLKNRIDQLIFSFNMENDQVVV